MIAVVPWAVAAVAARGLRPLLASSATATAAAHFNGDHRRLAPPRHGGGGGEGGAAPAAGSSPREEECERVARSMLPDPAGSGGWSATRALPWPPQKRERGERGRKVWTSEMEERWKRGTGGRRTPTSIFSFFFLCLLISLSFLTSWSARACLDCWQVLILPKF